MSLEQNDPRSRAAARSAYKMPAPQVGPCIWRPSPTDPYPMPAFITQVGDRSVMLTVFAPDNRAGLPKDGVRHISDPELSDNPDRSNGCWEFTPDQVRLGVAEALVHQLLDEVTGVTRQLQEFKSLVGA